MKTKNIFNLLPLLFIILFLSCEKPILGEDLSNNPEVVFETLWHDLDEHYSLFEVKGTNWDSLYSVYRPQVNSNTTDEQLWKICTNLIEHLDDSHTSVARLISTDSVEGYSSGETLNNLSKNDFSKNLIKNKYLEYLTNMPTEADLSFGKIKDKDIGYIYLGAEGGDDAGKIDEIITALKYHKAIILDIRQNGGGDDTYGIRISGAFSDSEKMLYTSQTRNGPQHSDFDAKTEHFSKKVGNQQFLKPVIILTDRATISAGEVFLIHMKSFNHITQIGDTTAGDFSDVSPTRFLPNGWFYRYSIKKFLLANGKSLDGIGHIPDVYIKNTPADIASNNDKVIEKAIDYLWVRYGIK